MMITVRDEDPTPFPYSQYPHRHERAVTTPPDMGTTDPLEGEAPNTNIKTNLTTTDIHHHHHDGGDDDGRVQQHLSTESEQHVVQTRMSASCPAPNIDGLMLDDSTSDEYQRTSSNYGTQPRNGAVPPLPSAQMSESEHIEVVTTTTTVMDSAADRLSDREEDKEERVDLNIQTDRFGFYGGDQYTTPESEPKVDAQMLRKREQKWLEMLENWPYYMNKRFDKVRDRCRKGIPFSLRGRAWKFLSGAAYHMESQQNRFAFEQLDAAPGEARWIDDIEKDIFRQFPEHELFGRKGRFGKIGQTDLFRLLKAYTVLHPEEGYCQGQAPVAATLLTQMPLKDAFYVFVQICHKYLPGYYSDGLEAIKLDGEILFHLLKQKSRLSYNHLKKNNIDPVLYMVQWFMCIFCRNLPWCSVLRVWDMFFCEGVKILFKVAIVLFRYSLGNREHIKAYPDMQGILQRLKNIPAAVMEEEFLVSRVIELSLEEEELERSHYKQLKKRLKEEKKQSRIAKKQQKYNSKTM